MFFSGPKLFFVNIEEAAFLLPCPLGRLYTSCIPNSLYTTLFDMLWFFVGAQLTAPGASFPRSEDGRELHYRIALHGCVAFYTSEMTYMRFVSANSVAVGFFCSLLPPLRVFQVAVHNLAPRSK